VSPMVTAWILSDYSQWACGLARLWDLRPGRRHGASGVQHTKLGWFRLLLMDKWVSRVRGMLQAAYAHQPVM